MVAFAEKENGKEIWGGRNDEFCFWCIEFEMRISYEIGMSGGSWMYLFGTLGREYLADGLYEIA